MSKPANSPRPNPGILDIAPYVPGKSKLEGEGPVIKLSSNETPLGPSPAAIEAYRQCAASLNLYPDGSSLALRRAISGIYGIDADQIVCGAGSDEILNLLAHAYLGPGDEAIYSQHGFLVYPIAIMANGAKGIAAPEKNLTTDIDAILERVSEKTRMVFIANPNNPTGTMISRHEIERLRRELPGRVLLVLDGAYAEYVNDPDYEAGIEMVAGNDNVVMTRTFSKIYGLAALRIGWAYCPPEIASVLNRIRGPFNLSSAAIEAGAAAIKDQDFMRESAAHNLVWREWVRNECENMGNMGLEVTPSQANFLLLHFPPEKGLSAAEADKFLLRQRIILRRLENYHLPNALRMSIGSEEECRAAVRALGDYLEQSQKS